MWDFVGLVVSGHVAASSRKNFYNFYGNAAIFVDQVLEFHLFERNKKNPSALCEDQGLKGFLIIRQIKLLRKYHLSSLAYFLIPRTVLSQNSPVEEFGSTLIDEGISFRYFLIRGVSLSH